MRTLPDKIRVVHLETSTVEVDEGGYLCDPNTWSEEFARWCADQEDITLTSAHWRVYEFMRDYLTDHGVAADARFVIKFLANEYSVDKRDAKALLFELFPQGYVKQACKIAGMRQPRAWSTG